MSKIEIQKKLIASTAHITKGENDWLKSIADGKVLEDIAIRDFEYGFDIYIGSENPGVKAKSDHLHTLIMMAYAADCRWLTLDCDGPVIPGLETFDW